MLDHIAEPERTRVIVMMIGVFVAAVGLAVPFASAWITQRITARRELRRDVQKLWMDLFRETTALVRTNAKYQGFRKSNADPGLIRDTFEQITSISLELMSYHQIILILLGSKAHKLSDALQKLTLASPRSLDAEPIDVEVQSNLMGVVSHEMRNLWNDHL